MKSLETGKKETIKKEIKETENQKAVFTVNDKRNGEKYEVVMDASGKNQVLNREEKGVELENKIKEAEKQESTKKLSQEKDDLIKEIKKLDSEFKKPGIKSEKTLIEKSILEKEVKVREIENQLRPAKKEKKELPEQTMEKEGERKQKIEKLWLEVEKNRKEYLEKDYKNNKVTARLKGVFGSFFKKDKEGAGYESDKELAEYRAYYDNSLLEHKKAMLDEARLRGASSKELLDIAKFYQVEANINLADVHDQVKIENQEGKISGFIKEHSQELIERYKKMHWAKKMAIGAAFGLVGVGAIYIGGVAVGIAGSAIAARRAIMGVITGTTVSLGFEAWGKKKTEKKIQKEIEKLEKNMTGLSEEEKNKILEGFIDKDIQDEDRKINKIKDKNLRHLAYGVAAGLGTMLAPKITRLFSEGAAPGGSIPEHPGGQNVPIGESGAPKMPGVVGASEQAIPGAENVIVEVQKGDSLGKIIGKQLEEKYQNYTDLNEAQKTYIIDALKDKVAADPETFGLENIDKLEIGQGLNLSEIFQGGQPEGLITGAQDLNSEQMQSILDNNQKLSDWVNANPGEELTSEKTAEILKGFEGAEDAPEVSSFEEAPGDSETPKAEEVEETLKAKEVEEIEKVPETKTGEIERVLGTSGRLELEDDLDIDKQSEKIIEKIEEKEPEIQFEKGTRGPEVALSEAAVEHNVNEVMPTQEIEIPGGKIILNSYGDGSSSVKLEAIVKPSAESADLLSKSADGRIDIKLTSEGEEAYKGRFANETQKKLFLKTTAERFATIRYNLFQGLEEAKKMGNQRAVDIIQHALDAKKQQCEKLYGKIFIK